MDKVCPNCDKSIDISYAKFCPHCGNPLTTSNVEDKKLKRFVKKANKLYQNTKQTLVEKTNEYRLYLAKRLDNYIEELRSDKPYYIASQLIPTNRKQQIVIQLEKIRNKITREHFDSDEEYDEWISNLDERISNTKCIICFGEWDNNDEIVVCKYCIHGGHKSHFENWLSNSSICPLCRESLTKHDLIAVKSI
jgi:hypothetical protein